MALFEDEDKVEYLHMCEHYLFKMSVLDFRQSILDLVLTISRKEATRVWRCISRTKMNVIFLSQTLSFQCMNHEASMTVLSIVLILRCYIMYNAKHIESDQVSPTRGTQVSITFQ
jgi:hypothetical protein